MKTIQILKALLTVVAFFITTAFYAQDKGMETITIEETDASISMEWDDQTDIVSYLSNSEDHTILIKAVKVADLVSALSGEGPFTLFAPTNNAFNSLSQGKLAKLLLPDNRSKLESVLKAHVIAGEISASDIKEAIEAGNGKAQLKTISGESLTASIGPDGMILTDANGGVSKVGNADIVSTNGIIHVLDAVILPLESGTN